MLDLGTFKSFFEPRYQNYISGCLAKSLNEQPILKSVGEHMQQLSRGGKRIRPFVTHLAYVSAGGEDIESLLPALYALELYHLFALIHDDIMDNAKTRHDIECMHSKFGNNMAILVGDLCLVWAMEAIASAPVSLRKKELFLQLSKETILGQMLDIQSLSVAANEEMLDLVIEMKTARYTFVYPMLIGLSHARDHRQSNKYAMLGLYLGRAFQRLDNLRDIMLGEKDLHKIPCADIVQGTPTHLTLYLDRQGKKDDIEAIYGFKGQSLTKDDIERIRAIFVASGAVENEKKAIKDELVRARKILASINMDVLAWKAWEECISGMDSKLSSLET